MHYVNQLNYKHIPYHTYTTMEEKTDIDRIRTVSMSGCGLCCSCMAIELLTDKKLEIEDCVKIAEDCSASHGVGTDMKMLGPVLAEKYGLVYTPTSDLSEAIGYLQDGGKIVAHVAVPEGCEIGLFTKGGHYILLNSTDGKEFCILDPSYTDKKFDAPERVGRIDAKNAPYLYCDVNTVHAECKEGKIKYHVFTRKKLV